MTLEQRRLMTMHAVEESNRVSVIQELRDLLDQKELFLSSMSHELRTPLNGIIGLSDALLVGSCGEITDGVTKTITTMKVSGARLLNLINDILDAASMKRGALILKQEKGALIIKQEKVTLFNAVLGDTGRIIQILHNLIGNSCKFTHKGSISISAQRQGNVMAVAVSDTGIGIPEDKHTAIFEAFEQVDAATTRTYGGTGLGLNLVKSLVDSHGGTVAVKSKVGSGTTFIFTLKIWSKSMQDNGAAFLAEMAALGASSKVSSSGASDETHKEMHKEVMKQGRRLPFKTSSFTGLFKKEETSHPKPSRSKLSRSAEPNPSHAEADLFPIEPAIPKAVLNWAVTKRLKKSGDKARVLSVDDDPINQMVIQSLLTPEGYEVTQAMDGEEALDVLNKGELLPDIVLLDVMMPGMSGYQVWAKIRKLYPASCLHAIMINVKSKEENIVCAKIRELYPASCLPVIMISAKSKEENIVCAKIRELYPASCLPVIMISAKSKEENIVEGLTKGANDYVVKPFGRQEILARVKAHLTFRDIVFMAGERAAEEQLELAMAPDVTLVSKVRTLLQVSGTKSTLPACMKRQLENGSGKQAHHELFNQLTMVVANFSNLTYLTEFVGADSVMLALTELYAKVQDLLDEHDCYLADTLEGNLVIVTGLDREANYAQVVEAINFAVDLLEVASSLTMVDGTTPFKLEIAIGIHTAAAQGVVVGVVHPVMYFTGNLPDVATYLQITSPENCIHVSRSVYKQYASPVNFVEVPGPPSRGQKEETYMYKAGSWREGMTRVADKCARFSLEHPFDTINLNATRMKPIQMSLLTLVQCDPGLLLELTVSGTTNPAIKAATSSLPRMSMNGSMSGMLSNRESRDAVEKKLLHEKEMVEEQLNEDKVDSLEAEMGTKEAEDKVDSLQAEMGTKEAEDKVDSLEAEMAVKAAEMAAKADKSVASDAELAISQAQVAVLETSKQAVDNGDAHAKALQERVEELTAQLEELQEVYSHAFKLEEQTKQMEKHNADLELQLSIALTRQNQLQNQLSEDRSSSLMITGEQAISQSPALSSASHSDLEQLENSLVSHFVKPHGANTVEGKHDPSMTDMALVLEDLGLDYLTPRFKIEEINLNILPYLDDKMLRSLGAVSVGSRLKLRLAARVLGGHHEAP
eukprot:gene23091-30286_t